MKYFVAMMSVATWAFSEPEGRGAHPIPYAACFGVPDVLVRVLRLEKEIATCPFRVGSESLAVSCRVVEDAKRVK